MDLKDKCRLCLMKSSKSGNELFFPMDENFQKKFSEVTNFDIENENNSEIIPKTVCITCVTEFEQHYNYRTRLICTQKRLNLLIGIKEDVEKESNVIKLSQQKPEYENETETTSIAAGSDGILEFSDSMNFDDGEVQVDEVEEVEHQFKTEIDEAEILECEELEEDDEEEDEYQHEPSGIVHYEEIPPNESTTNTDEYDMDPSNQHYMEDQDESEEYVDEYVDKTDEGKSDVESMYITLKQTQVDSDDDYVIVKSDESLIRPKRKYVKQTKDKQFKCWITNCNAAFAFRATMKKHMYQMHSIDCTRTTCLMCGREFAEYSEFLLHVKKHTRKSQCDICKLTFVSEEKMQAHHTRVHNKKSNDVEERSFRCHVSFHYFVVH